MFLTFIRGRHYYTSRQRKFKYKKPIIRRIAKISKRISRSLRSSFNRLSTRKIKHRAKYRKRRNILRKSYLRRYILPRKKSFKKRTLAFNPGLPLDYQEEDKVFNKLRHNIRRYELNRMLTKKWGHRSYFQLLAKRPTFFGRVYISHRLRNTFVTINNIVEKGYGPHERVMFKSSCGLLGYVGPKRETPHARAEVTKSAGAYLTNVGLTSIDIIFPSRIERLFRRLVRGLLMNIIYVRYIIVRKRKPHGLMRRRKMKRT